MARAPLVDGDKKGSPTCYSKILWHLFHGNVLSCSCCHQNQEFSTELELPVYFFLPLKPINLCLVCWIPSACCLGSYPSTRTWQERTCWCARRSLGQLWLDLRKGKRVSRCTTWLDKLQSYWKGLFLKRWVHTWTSFSQAEVTRGSFSHLWNSRIMG